MTEETHGTPGEFDGDALGRGPKRRRGNSDRTGPVADYLRLEYPAESPGWVLSSVRKPRGIRSRLLSRLTRRRARPPSGEE
jgi:hypothetical protein